MRAGTLNRRVVIERRVAGKDDGGEALQQWTAVVSTYAAIQPQSGREFAAAGAVVSNVTALIDIRYRTDVAASMRVRYGAQLYAIEAVMDLDLEHRTLRLVCGQGASQG